MVNNVYSFRKLEELEKFSEAIHVDPSTNVGVAEGKEKNEVPAELLAKLEKTENLLNHLKTENRHQKKELAELRQNIGQDSQLRYRGCNHPARRNFRHSADGTQRSSSLVRLSPQRQGRLPLLRAGISRQVIGKNESSNRYNV